MCINNFEVIKDNANGYLKFSNINKAWSYPISKDLSFNECEKLLNFLKQLNKANPNGFTDYEVLYAIVTDFLKSNNLKLNINNVYHKYYNESFDEFLCEMFL